MNIGEFLIALGVKADTDKLKDFDKGLEDVSKSAEQTESSMLKAYDATDSFVSAIEGALGVIGFFTGVIGGMWGMFHGTIMELEELIEDEKLLTKVTKEQIEQQKKYKESVETLGKRFQSLKVELAFGFLPTMQKMIDGLDNFLEKNKDVIVNGVMAFINILTSFMQIITNTIRFIDMIVDKTVGWKNLLIALGIALAWVKRAMILAFITNPVVWMMAAIAGLLILIDDFMTYLDGGESEFGEFWGASLKWIEDNKDAINAIKQVFVDFVEFLTGIVALIVGIFTGDTALMSAAWEGMIENFIAAWNGLAMFFMPAAEFITNTINNAFDRAKKFVIDIFNSMLNAIKSFISTLGAIFTNVFSLITAPFAQAFDWIVNKFSELPAIIGGIASKLTFGLSDKIGSAVTNTANRISNYTSTTTASIQVNGATNPQVTANAINANLNSMTQNNMGGMVKA